MIFSTYSRAVSTPGIVIVGAGTVALFPALAGIPVTSRLYVQLKLSKHSSDRTETVFNTTFPHLALREIM